MKAFNKKKGFTIVELVIVIAVIGVLTAVLVPTFVNLVNKANQASDESLVTNLNKALAMAEKDPETQGENHTMHDAITDLKAYGFGIDQLVTKYGENELVWNAENNRFFKSVADAKATDVMNVWGIASSITGSETHSVYAGNGFTATEILNLNVGFDAGDHEGITTINFATDLARTVSIRTAGSDTVLTVNAVNATVHHYDVLDGLTITAIAGESYHEHGTINTKAVISQGHIEIEEGAEVPEVSVENATGGVKVTANEGTLVSADSTSSDQTTVIANTEDVFVSGVDAENIGGTKASEVETPTAILNEAELTAALSAGKGYLELGADFAVENPFAITRNSIFDFAGHRITSEDLDAAVLTNRAELTIIDTGENGGITSSSDMLVQNKGKMTINGGKFVGTNDWLSTEAQAKVNDRGVISNSEEGTLLIKDVDVEVAHDFAILNAGQTTIDYCNVVSTAESYSGYAYGYAVSSYGGMLTLNGGDIQGVHGCVGINAGEAEINDVHAETVVGLGNSYRALYIAGERDKVNVQINGGYFKSYRMEAASIGNNSDGGLGRLATAEIHGGTFINGKAFDTQPAIKIINRDWSTGANYGIGEAMIDGGKFSSDVTGAHGVVTCVKGEDGLWVVNA